MPPIEGGEPLPAKENEGQRTNTKVNAMQYILKIERILLLNLFHNLMGFQFSPFILHLEIILTYSSCTVRQHYTVHPLFVRWNNTW